MARPTKIPRWATTGARVEPAELKKDAGWATQEKPPAQTMNWLQGLTGDWINFFQEPKVRPVPLTTWFNRATVAPWSLSVANFFWTSTGLAADTAALWIPLPVITGDIVTGYRLTVRHPAVATAGTIEAQIHDLTRTSGGALVDGSPPGGAGVTSSAATTDRQYLVATGLTMDVEADHRYWLVLNGVNGGNVQRIAMEAEFNVIPG